MSCKKIFKSNLIYTLYYIQYITIYILYGRKKGLDSPTIEELIDIMKLHQSVQQLTR